MLKDVQDKLYGPDAVTNATLKFPSEMRRECINMAENLKEY